MNTPTTHLVSRSLRCSVLGVTIALALLHPDSAHAEDLSNEARILYRKGSVAFDEGDDVLARKYYLESLELEESFDTMCNLARTEARSDLFVEAYEHIRMCLYLFPKDEELQAAKEKYAGLRDHIRAEITYEQAHPIDEKVEQEIERRERETAVVEADVALPASGLDEPSQQATDTEAPGPPKRNWVPAYVLGGVTVATFGTSMVFRALAGTQLKQIEEFTADKDNSYCLDPDRAGCAELAERVKRHDNYADASNGTLVAAGIGAGVTLGYVIYVLAKKPKKEPAVRASVSVEKTGGFVSLAGTF